MERIVLRSWQLSDAADVYGAFQETLDLAHVAGPFNTVDDTQAWIQELITATESKQVLALALETSELVTGGVMLQEFDWRNKNAAVSFWISERVRGLGFASRCVETISAYAFKELGIFRLQLGHRIDDTITPRVAINAGFVSEGKKRGKYLFKGKRYDMLEYGRLATDPYPDHGLLPVEIN